MPPASARAGRRRDPPCGGPSAPGVNWDSTRRRAASPKRRARSRSRRRRSTASASARAFLGGTRRPVSPSTTTSGFPPTRVATTGRPAAIASRRLFDIPSQTEERTNTSKWGRSLAAWGTAPRKRTPPFNPSCCARASRDGAERPVTDHHELRRRYRLRDERRGLQQFLVPSLPDETADGADHLIARRRPGGPPTGPLPPGGQARRCRWG